MSAPIRNCFGIPDQHNGWTITQGADDRFYATSEHSADTWEELAEILDSATKPFGYWVEQKHSDPILLRQPAYIPEPSNLRTVTPLYAAHDVPSNPNAVSYKQLQSAYEAMRDSSRDALAGWHAEREKLWAAEAAVAQALSWLNSEGNNMGSSYANRICNAKNVLNLIAARND